MAQKASNEARTLRPVQKGVNANRELMATLTLLLFPKISCNRSIPTFCYSFPSEVLELPAHPCRTHLDKRSRCAYVPTPSWIACAVQGVVATTFNSFPLFIWMPQA